MYILSLEFACFLTTTRFSLRKDRRARCVMLFSVVFISALSVHVQQLSHWRNCTIGGPRTFYFVINWATFLKRLRTPALGGIAKVFLPVKISQFDHESCRSTQLSCRRMPCYYVYMNIFSLSRHQACSHGRAFGDSAFLIFCAPLRFCWGQKNLF